MTGQQASQVLRMLGVAAPVIDTIRAEVIRVIPQIQGALEQGDLWAVAIAEVWGILQQSPSRGGGYIRLRVRGAVRDQVRRELRAAGTTPVLSRHKGKHCIQTIRWPVYWPAPDVPVHPPAREVAARCGRWYAARREAAA